MFGSHVIGGADFRVEDSNNYGSAYGKQSRHHLSRFPPSMPCGPQDSTQGDYQNSMRHFQSHIPAYRPRGHPRMTHWVRSPRFSNPAISSYGDGYSPRGFHGNSRGGVISRPGMRDPRETHHFGQPYNYRNGRRHGRQHHIQTYQTHVNCFPNQYVNQQHEEYVPLAFNSSPHTQSYTPSQIQYLPQIVCPASNVDMTVAYVPHHSGSYTSHRNSSEVEFGTDGSQKDVAGVTSYCPENVSLPQLSGLSGVLELQCGSVKSTQSSSVIQAAVTVKQRRRPSESSDDTSGSVCLNSSESSSDGFENEDSGVSTFEPSEEEEKCLHESAEVLKVEVPVDTGNEGNETIARSFLFDDQSFLLAYIEAKSAHVIDGKGHTSTDEISCYGVYFGPGNPKNMVDEVNTKYNQERGKSGYIHGVIKAVGTAKEGNFNRVHLVMGSSFVMKHLSSWVKNLKSCKASSTNWTEWKHHKEIGLLLDTIDGMVMKFSLAHPRDDRFNQCKESVSQFWDEMKMRRLAECGPHNTWPAHGEQ